jgi:hypothetical protein
MKNLLPQFQEEENRLLDDAQFLRGNLRGGLDYISTNQLKNIKSFLSSSHSRLIDKIVEMIGTWTPTCGYESEEEKGFQKGIIAEQKLIQSKLKQI